MTEQIKVESEVTFTIVPHWLLDVCTPIEISTYIALGKYANNKTKECWPSVATISKDIGRAKKNTIKALQGLEEKGKICRDYDYERRTKLRDASWRVTPSYLATGSRRSCEIVRD